MSDVVDKCEVIRALTDPQQSQKWRVKTMEKRKFPTRSKVSVKRKADEVPEESDVKDEPSLYVDMVDDCFEQKSEAPEDNTSDKSVYHIASAENSKADALPSCDRHHFYTK